MISSCSGFSIKVKWNAHKSWKFQHFCTRPFWNKGLKNHWLLKIAQYVLIGLLFYIRYCPRILDQVGLQTTSAHIENKHCFTKSCHHQIYQNYEQHPQNLYFQGHFLVSKIKQIFLIFFVKSVWLEDQLL